MNKLDLILIFIIAVMLAAAALAEPVTPVQAAGLAQAPVEQAAFPASPATGIAVGLTGVLFGALTFLPLLVRNNAVREG